MKKSILWRLGVIFAFASAALFFACRKDILLPPEDPVEVQAGIQSKMRAWFEKRYTKNLKIRGFRTYGATTLSGNAAPMEINPDWDNATTFLKGDSVIGEIPLSDDTLKSIVKRNPAAESKFRYSATKVLIIQNGESTRSVLMTIIGNDTYNTREKLLNVSLLKKDPDFDGIVLYRTMQGYFLNGFKYLNGKPVARISTHAAESGTTSKTSGNHVMTEQTVVCDVIFYYHEILVPCDNGEVIPGFACYKKVPVMEEWWICTIYEGGGTGTGENGNNGNNGNNGSSYSWPPIFIGTFGGTDFSNPAEGGTSGGGGDGPYNPCDPSAPEPAPVESIGGSISQVPPPPCDEDNPDPGGSGVIPIPIPPFNPFSPVTFPEGEEWEAMDQDWINGEDLFAQIKTDLLAEDLPAKDPLPESYYKGGYRVDMRNAPANSPVNALGEKRNNRWFFKQVAAAHPEYFDQENRIRIQNRQNPKVNAQWVKYHPTHAAYIGEVLEHHHINQGRFATAIPRKVHVVWRNILHTMRNAGRIQAMRGRLNSLSNVITLMSSVLDIYTGNPASWLRWFESPDIEKIGKLYYDATKEVYYAVDSYQYERNSAGVVVKVTVTYTCYDSAVYIQEENKWYGVLINSRYKEIYYPLTDTSEARWLVPVDMSE